ncbi:MAG: amino acid adenylation domain-containing protein [Acidimicrobiales bacterium]
MSRPFLLSQLIVQAAERNPQAPAVRSDDGELSYGQAAAATARLAATLQAAGVRPGDRVGLYLHKSVASFVAVHAVLRAGAAYVPIDPWAPPRAVAAMVADCGIAVLVSENRQRRSLSELVPLASGLRCLVGVDEGPDGVGGVEGGAGQVELVPPGRFADGDGFVAPKVLSDDLAYVMYTSGSTGTPKGLMHTHHSGLAYAQLAAHTYGIGPDDRLANSAPFHFDISTFELFAGPLVGAMTLVIPEPYLKLPASLSQLVADQRCTFWYSVPFLLGELFHRGALSQRDLSSLRWVLFGGEVADPEVIAGLGRYWPNARFSNSYGPAEVNQCLFHHLPGPPPPGHAIPIGMPWDDAEVVVVDEDRQPVPEGVVGELLVRSSTMMAGYWGRPELDERAFVHTPLPGGRHARWYATGDLVRCGPGGVYEFIGRRDHQVKVRGNRVELESVESVLASLPGVAHAVAAVVAVEGTTALVAGVAAERPGAVVLEELLGQVAEQLPPYAVPYRLVWLEHLPLTPSGKIDRRAIRQQLAEGHVTEGKNT